MCSPTVAMMGISAAVSVIGGMAANNARNRAQAVANQAHEVRVRQMRYNITNEEMRKKDEVDKQVVRRGIIADENLKEQGLIDIYSAGNGVLLNELGSSHLALKQEQAGNAKFASLVSDHDSLLRLRQSDIKIGNIESGIQLAMLENRESNISTAAKNTAQNWKSISSAFRTGGKAVGGKSWTDLGFSSTSSTPSAFNQDVSTLGAF